MKEKKTCPNCGSMYSGRWCQGCIERFLSRKDPDQMDSMAIHMEFIELEIFQIPAVLKSMRAGEFLGRGVLVFELFQENSWDDLILELIEVKN